MKSVKYIYTDENGFTTYDRYFEYLESVRDILPSHIYTFASDSMNYDLSSKSSLHDSWLECLTVKEYELATDKQLRNIDISLLLLGPYHDTNTLLSYSSVKEYSINYKAGGTKYTENHGDILVHEIRVESDLTFCHEIKFDRNTILEVVCEDINFNVTNITSSRPIG